MITSTADQKNIGFLHNTDSFEEMSKMDRLHENRNNNAL